MSAAEPKVRQAVLSFLERQKLSFEESAAEYCSQFKIQSGSQVAFVSVYNSGKIVIGGRNGSLRKNLLSMKEAIEAGDAVAGQALPFEIEKFPDTIRERVPACDPVILRFVAEAISCLRADALLGCAFMLGAASERAIGLLIQSYASAIRDNGLKEKFTTRVNNRAISVRYDEFLRSFKSSKTRPRDGILGQDIDVIIGGTFQFCRITRNEIGHPQIVPDLDRGVLLANIGHFVTYIERLYALMTHFEQAGVEL